MGHVVQRGRTFDVTDEREELHEGIERFLGAWPGAKRAKPPNPVRRPRLDVRREAQQGVPVAFKLSFTQALPTWVVDNNAPGSIRLLAHDLNTMERRRDRLPV